jgi:hypothetical protein
MIFNNGGLMFSALGTTLVLLILIRLAFFIWELRIIFIHVRKNGVTLYELKESSRSKGLNFYFLPDGSFTLGAVNRLKPAEVLIVRTFPAVKL